MQGRLYFAPLKAEVIAQALEVGQQPIIKYCIDLDLCPSLPSPPVRPGLISQACARKIQPGRSRERGWRREEPELYNEIRGASNLCLPRWGIEGDTNGALVDNRKLPSTPLVPCRVFAFVDKAFSSPYVHTVDVAACFMKTSANSFAVPLKVPRGVSSSSTSHIDETVHGSTCERLEPKWLRKTHLRTKGAQRESVGSLL